MDIDTLRCHVVAKFEEYRKTESIHKQTCVFHHSTGYLSQFSLEDQFAIMKNTIQSTKYEEPLRIMLRLLTKTTIFDLTPDLFNHISSFLPIINVKKWTLCKLIRSWSVEHIERCMRRHCAIILYKGRPQPNIFNNANDFWIHFDRSDQNLEAFGVLKFNKLILYKFRMRSRAEFRFLKRYSFNEVMVFTENYNVTNTETYSLFNDVVSRINACEITFISNIGLIHAQQLESSEPYNEAMLNFIQYMVEYRLNPQEYDSENDIDIDAKKIQIDCSKMNLGTNPALGSHAVKTPLYIRHSIELLAHQRTPVFESLSLSCVCINGKCLEKLSQICRELKLVNCELNEFIEQDTDDIDLDTAYNVVIAQTMKSLTICFEDDAENEKDNQAMRVKFRNAISCENSCTDLFI
eukprot:209485_1